MHAAAARAINGRSDLVVFMRTKLRFALGRRPARQVVINSPNDTRFPCKVTWGRDECREAAVQTERVAPSEGLQKRSLSDETQMVRPESATPPCPTMRPSPYRSATPSTSFDSGDGIGLGCGFLEGNSGRPAESPRGSVGTQGRASPHVTLT